MTDFDAVEQRRTEYQSLAPRRRRRQRAAPTFRQRLKTWHTIPDFLRDNEFIRTGYRANFSLKEAFISLFQLHNETLNVWTHLLGVVIFACLAVYLATSPPAPLAHPRESLEHLWSSVQDSVQHFGENVHSLHDAFDLHISGLQDSLHESLAVVHENLEHARDSLHIKMEPVANQLHKMSSALSQALHNFQGSLGNRDGAVHQKLAAVRNNLEKSFTSVQDSLHTLQDDLSDNLGAAKARLKKSLSALQESLAGLQTLMRDTYPRSTSSDFNQTLAVDQCPTTASTLSTESLRDGVVRWPVFLYVSGVMLCLLVSSVCHLFACCSRHATKYMWRFDYTGITVLIVTSFYPAIYYGFLCEAHWIAFYLCCTTLLGVGAVFACLLSHMQQPKFRPVRAGMFVGLGLFGIIPWGHQLLINFHEPTVRTVILYELAMAAFYLGGALFFVSRVPERFKPGAFDLLLSSHQIFHIFVVIAACIHFQAVLHLMEWRESTNGCPLTVL